MGDRVATLLNNEAVPVLAVLLIELFFDFASDVTELLRLIVLECSQSGNYCELLLIRFHVCALDEHLLISVLTESFQSGWVITRHHSDRVAARFLNPKSLNSGRHDRYLLVPVIGVASVLVLHVCYTSIFS